MYFAKIRILKKLDCDCDKPSIKDTTGTSMYHRYIKDTTGTSMYHRYIKH
jgi:hypothetical protein